jgi:hypothetical protein
VKQIFIVGFALLVTGCATGTPAEVHAAAACAKTCTQKDLDLSGAIVIDDGDAEKCLCEVKDESASGETPTDATFAIAARMERR